jgi:hypothetical protein
LLETLTSRLEECQAAADAQATSLEATQAELSTHKENLKRTSEVLGALRNEHSAMEEQCKKLMLDASLTQAARDELELFKTEVVEENQKAVELLVQEGRRAEKLAEERNAATSKAEALHKELTCKEREVGYL